eukprot:scaffold13903_cov22-Prasinocladus_malaysianus.AAC.1
MEGCMHCCYHMRSIVVKRLVNSMRDVCYIKGRMITGRLAWIFCDRPSVGSVRACGRTFGGAFSVHRIRGLAIIQRALWTAELHVGYEAAGIGRCKSGGCGGI